MTDIQQHSCIEVKVSSLCRCRSFIHYISTAIKPDHVPSHFKHILTFIFESHEFRSNKIRFGCFGFFFFFYRFFHRFCSRDEQYYVSIWSVYAAYFQSSPSLNRFAQHSRRREIIKKYDEILKVFSAKQDIEQFFSFWFCIFNRLSNFPPFLPFRYSLIDEIRIEMILRKCQAELS